MKKSLKFIFIVVGVLIISLFIIFRIIPSREEKLKEQTNEIIQMIETFRQEKGRLPLSLKEIGIEEKEEGPLYYEKQDSANYIIWFGTFLGESQTYHSDTKEWTDY